MIHFNLDGSQVTINQAAHVAVGPYVPDTNNANGNVAVPVGAATQILNNANFLTFFTIWVGFFKNVGTNGSRIGIGFAATITFATAPLILDPSDVWPLPNLNTSIWAVTDGGAPANLAGTVNRMIFATR